MPARQLSLLVVGLLCVTSFSCTSRLDEPPTVPGIRAPRTYFSSSISLPRDTPIIGVVVGNRSRAYMVEALSLPKQVLDAREFSKHIVNDVVNHRPVTVAHCNRAACTTAYTAPGREPLEVAVRGWNAEAQAMEVNYHGQSFLQDKAPLERFPFEETTWGEWLDAHPDSDIYLGEYARYYWVGS